METLSDPITKADIYFESLCILTHASTGGPKEEQNVDLVEQ